MSDYNEYLDEESREFEYQQAKEGFDKQAEHLTRWQAEKMQKDAAADQQNIFNDALKEAGISNDQFNELASKNPQETREAFVDGVKNYVKTVSRSRDKSGRFTKQQTQGTPGQSVQQQREQASPKSLDSYRETVKQRPLAYEEELDIINILFPDPI